VLGDANFRASIKKYLEDNAFSEVETSEFLAAIREATGTDLQWFFDEWIYRGGEPSYQVNWKEASTMYGLRQTIVSVRQVQARDELIGLFSMPVGIEVHYDDGTVSSVMPFINDELEEVYIDNPGKKNISFVLFDPGRRILKTVDFQKSYEEWSAQLLKAENLIDRYDALLALRSVPLEQKRDVLKKAYVQETFHLTKGEIIRQLGADHIDGWQKDPDPLVRRAALLSLKTSPENLRKDFEALLSDESYVNVELALDLLCRSFPERTTGYLEKTGTEIGWRGMNIRMKWLEIAIGAGQREYLETLVRYSGPHVEFETRINAFNLLRKMNYLDEEAAINLLDGYVYWNYKVSNAAKEVIQYFAQQLDYRKMLEMAVIKGNFTGEQQKKLQSILK